MWVELWNVMWENLLDSWWMEVTHLEILLEVPFGLSWERGCGCWTIQLVRIVFRVGSTTLWEEPHCNTCAWQSLYCRQQFRMNLTRDTHPSTTWLFLRNGVVYYHNWICFLATHSVLSGKLLPNRHTRIAIVCQWWKEYAGCALATVVAVAMIAILVVDINYLLVLPLYWCGGSQ